MIPLKDFLEKLQDNEQQSLNEAFVNRNKELSGIQESNYLNRYAIQIIIESSEKQLLLEHDQYKKFKKSTDLYYKHPENPNIPVQAHYHIVDNKSKQEIYAVNMDGTAHHRTNKGFTVPKKQAEQLRNLGVTIPDNNILESKSFAPNEYFTFFIILED